MTAMNVDQSVLQQLQQYVNDQINIALNPIQTSVQNILGMQTSIDALGAKMNELGITVGEEKHKGAEDGLEGRLSGEPSGTRKTGHREWGYQSYGDSHPCHARLESGVDRAVGTG